MAIGRLRSRAIAISWFDASRTRHVVRTSDARNWCSSAPICFSPA
jgi:hypothetical protein